MNALSRRLARFTFLRWMALLGLMLSAASSALAAKTYSDNGDGTVTDPTTGLQWMRCSMGQTWDGSTCNGTTRTYTWGQANALTGTVTFAGQSDWRMPNIRELSTILDLSMYQPAIDKQIFPSTLSSHYWSSSPGVNYANAAYAVDFNDGTKNNYSQNYSFGVRLVRGGGSNILTIARPVSDYVDHGDGTVTHSPTGLTWMRCSMGQTWNGSNCAGNSYNYTWNEANAFTGTTSFMGHADWRLPTQVELESLVDYTKPSWAINEAIFPTEMSPDWWWSSSPDVNDSAYAWRVTWSGYSSKETRSSYVGFGVRLVRSGQSFDSFTLTLTRAGTGTGAVTSGPAGIQCGATCSASFNSGTSVTLTATPTTGSTFAGWSGACSGTGSCTVSMTQAQSVTASFTSVLPPKTYSDNADGTVTDPTTGLIWMRCSMGQTWTGTTCTGTATTYTWYQANALTGMVNFAGQSDWRVPNIRELQTIVDRSRYSPAIDTVAFPNTPASYFWTASASTGISGYAWPVYFYDGGTNPYGNKSDGNQVRLVRGGQSLGLLDIARPSTDYVDHGDGTVTHTPTGLMWQRCAVGQTWTGNTCSGTASAFTYDDANLLTSSFAGQSDWRLPTAEDLLSLVDYSTASPAINSTLFPNTASFFWVATADAHWPGYAWYVFFGSGAASSYSLKSTTDQVRLVRTGNSAAQFQTIGTISFSPISLAVGATTTASATATSSLAVTFSSTTQSICTVNGTTVTGVAAGTCTVAADQAGNGTYSAAPQVRQSVTVNALTAQTITFTNPGAKTLGTASFALVATGGTSGNAVTFTSQTTGVCTVSGSMVTLVAAGACTVAANQAGNASYAAASQVLQSFAVNSLISQTISFTNPGAKTLGAAPFALSATGGASGNSVTFTSQTIGVCTVSGSTVTLVAVGTCTIAANQAGNASYAAAPQVTQSITVSAAPPASTLSPYDGIYQWDDGYYLSVHQIGGGTLIGTIYWVYTANTEHVGARAVSEADTFDLSHGQLVGSTATMTGTRFYRGCALSYDFTFNPDASLTVRLNSVSNSPGVSVADVDCAARYNSTESVRTIPRIY